MVLARHAIRRTIMQSSPMSSDLIVYCHSTFRGAHGQQLLPRGLDWDMDGVSHLAYVAASDESSSGILRDNLPSRRAILKAHNRWCFAKNLPFRTLDDMLQVTVHGPQHILVDWTPTRRVFETIKYQGVSALIANDKAVTNVSDTPTEVWINGIFHSILSSETVDSILSDIAAIKSPKISYKRSDGIIRIERFFEGAIRNYQVFEHLMDYLIVLEDVQVLDERTILGTATLPDWIIGGMLTSRLWVQEQPNGDILCLRPLIDDDPTTSDRTYRLGSGKQDDKDKLDQVRAELRRLRYLAGLKHPYKGVISSTRATDILESEHERRAQHRRNSKKRFTF